jgi:hypothetical protein
MKCSIGSSIHEECFKSTYGKVSKNLKLMSDLSNKNKNLIKKRLDVDGLTTICDYHIKKYLDNYYFLFGRTCCDPLKKHKKRINKGLNEIKLEMVEECNNFKLIPGKALCKTCIQLLFKKNEDTSISLDDVESEYECVDSDINSINKVCNVLGVSPVTINKLPQKRRSCAIEKKVEKINFVVKKKTVEYI